MAEWMLRALAASLLVGLAALAADELARLRRRPRRWVWASTIGATVLLPLVGSWLSVRWGGAGLLSRLFDPGGAWLAWSGLSRLFGAGPGSGAASWADRVAPGAPGAAGALDAPAVPIAWLPSPDTLLAAGWATGSVVLLLVFLATHRVLARARRAAHPVRLDAGSPVLVTATVGPAVVGVLRPRVLVPRWVLDAPVADRRLVLAHEREHVRARDPLLLAAATAALVAMPWNPILWWQHARLRRAVETDCDARVLAGGTDARAYGRILLETTRRGTALPAPGLAFSRSANLLERRILAMTDRLPKRRWTRLAALAPAAALLLAVACEVSSPGVVEPDPAIAGAAGHDARVGDAETAERISVDGEAAERERRIALTRDMLDSEAVTPSTERAVSGARDALDAARERRSELTRTAIVLGDGVSFRVNPDDVKPSGEYVLGREVPLLVASNRDRREPPLVYVDGTPVGLGDDRLRSLDPDDILSIEVVSGAAARRVEGEAAAGGIIRITTRAPAN